jgi:hypothetical protein
MTFADVLRARVDAAARSRGVQSYTIAREHVLRMKDQAPHVGGTADPSIYWQEELANFDYMLEAHPLVIERLRHHTYHLTGLRVYDYRSRKDQARAAFAEKLAALVELGGKKLLVPEAPDLGGFGFELDDELFNIDTLKFYECLIALKKGSVIEDFDASPTRRIVWEIGAGWGGFAYQFKKLFPNTTYVIVDFPELFLFSATYLMTMFPDATARFYDRDAPGQLDDLSGVDFLFWPHYALDALRLPKLDLTINMVSFQEMTTEQVSAYVAHAHELGSPYLYSLNRDRSSYNDELTSVGEIIETRFWPHEVEVLDVPYTQMLDRRRAESIAARSKRVLGLATEAPPRRIGDYRHIVGWRRVEPR